MARTDRRIALDLDGTLIDARLRQVGVAAEALASVAGERLDEKRFWRAKRSGADTAAALARIGFEHSLAAAVAVRWAERIESDEWLARDRALPGVRGVLRSITSDGREIIVITARRRAAGAQLSLEAAGLAPFVRDLVVVDPGTAVSEKAAALRRANACCFIGDTGSDGEAARAANVPFAAVATGQRSPGYMRERGYEPRRSLRAALNALR